MAGRGKIAGHWPLITALLFLSACGFHPMYGKDPIPGSASAMRGNMSIDPMGGREGQIFKIALEDKFNPEGLSTKDAEYRLSISLRKGLVPSVIKSDNTIQRYDLRFDSDFKLYKKGSNKPLYTGHIRRIGSYNVAVNANFATYEAEEDTIQRTLQELAEDYVWRVSGILADNPQAPPDPAKPAAKPMTPTPVSALTIAPSKPEP